MTDTPTLDHLRRQTEVFFDLHWPHGEAQPEWSERWEFLGPIPNHEVQGCYALLRSDAVVYIGVGAGKGTARYRGAGLGTRLHPYWRKHPGGPHPESGAARYVAAEKWVGTDAIVTIGFPPERGYLAYALEPYLIARLKPGRNVVGK